MKPLSRYPGLPVLAFALMALVVLVCEPYIFNILREGHFNWVSHHSLAIAKHSTPEMGYAGYSCRLLRGDGSFFYDYFNRYPFPFALASRSLLHLVSHSSELLIYGSRQLMNILFLVNCGVFVLIGMVLGFGRWLSVFSLLIVAPSRSWLYYKSMYHFDQPALLGLSLLLLLVAFLWKHPSGFGRYRLAILMIAAGISVSSGRSGSTMIFLAACAVIHLLQPRSFWPSAGRDFLVSLAFSLLVLSGFTGYSIMVEAKSNGVHWVDTSVVQSALRRLGISVSGFSDPHVKRLSWSQAVPRIIRFALRYCSPGFGILLAIGLLAQLKKLSVSKIPISLGAAPEVVFNGLSRPVFALNAACALTGLIWCFGMKNLVVFHDYSAMYILPFLYLSAISVGHQIMQSIGAFQSILLCLALAVFVFSLLATQVAMQMRPVSQASYNNIRRFYAAVDSFRSDASRPGVSLPPVLRDPQWLPGSPYAQCLYLEHPLVSSEDLSRLRRGGASLTIAQPPALVGSR
jgi:hypothetical protein